MSSHQNSNLSDGNRRSFIAKGFEWLSITPLAALAVDNVIHGQKNYELDLKGAQLPSRPKEQAVLIQELFRLSENYKLRVDSLLEAYRTNYHKSRTDVVPSIDSEGKLTLRVETTYYWEIPKGLPSEDQIGTWSNYANKVVRNLSQIDKEPTLNLGQLREVAIEAKSGNKIAQSVLSAVIYTGQIAVLLNYEEMKHAITSLDAAPSLGFIGDRRTEERRSFIKVLAAGAGALTAFQINSYNRDRLENGVENLKVARKNVLEDYDSLPMIEQVIGYNLNTLATTVRLQSLTAMDAKKLAINEASVKDAFNRFTDAAGEFHSALSQILEDEEKLDLLAKICHSNWATNQLRSANTWENSRVAGALVLQSLGVAGVMTLLIVPAEIVNQKMRE